jgi:TolA-binding protein
MKLLNILLQAMAQQGVSGMGIIFFLLLAVLVGVIAFYVNNKNDEINELKTQLAKKNSKINQLEEQLAEQQNNKVFKIGEDGTIFRVDEDISDKNDIAFCPYCGKKLK